MCALVVLQHVWSVATISAVKCQKQHDTKLNTNSVLFNLCNNIPLAWNNSYDSIRLRWYRDFIVIVVKENNSGAE